MSRSGFSIPMWGSGSCHMREGYCYFCGGNLGYVLPNGRLMIDNIPSVIWICKNSDCMVRYKKEKEEEKEKGK